MATTLVTAPKPDAQLAGLVIALLIGVYGLVLTVLGAGFTTRAEIAKAAGVNINLWAGIGSLVAGAAFVVWARLRPLAVPVRTEDEEASQPPPDAPPDAP